MDFLSELFDLPENGDPCLDIPLRLFYIWRGSSPLCASSFLISQ